MVQKRAESSITGPKKPVFWRNFSVAELGVTPYHPLTEDHSGKKNLAESGGTPLSL